MFFNHIKVMCDTLLNRQENFMPLQTTEMHFLDTVLLRIWRYPFIKIWTVRLPVSSRSAWLRDCCHCFFSSAGWTINSTLPSTPLNWSDVSVASISHDPCLRGQIVKSKETFSPGLIAFLKNQSKLGFKFKYKK